MHSVNMIFALLELPFLLMCVYFAFRTATALKGGVFGYGMALLAWGFIVMAIGHALMQVEHFIGFSPLNALFGPVLGPAAWVVALVLTWTLSGVGFYKIYSVSKSTVGA